jgi:hypothetical protein
VVQARGVDRGAEDHVAQLRAVAAEAAAKSGAVHSEEVARLRGLVDAAEARAASTQASLEGELVRLTTEVGQSIVAQRAGRSQVVSCSTSQHIHPPATVHACRSASLMVAWGGAGR